MPRMLFKAPSPSRHILWNGKDQWDGFDSAPRVALTSDIEWFEVSAYRGQVEYVMASFKVPGWLRRTIRGRKPMKWEVWGDRTTVEFRANHISIFRYTNPDA